MKDNLRQNDPSKTPLQFVYEAADCRMFYTKEMVGDVTAVWKGVVDRMFRNGTAKCVEGSIGDESSVSGGGQRKAGDVPPARKAGAELESNSAGERGTDSVWWAGFGVAVSIAMSI